MLVFTAAAIWCFAILIAVGLCVAARRADDDAAAGREPLVEPGTLSALWPMRFDQHSHTTTS